jgi:hypothetical protein
MQKSLTSPTARKWQSYNRWRSKNRKLDQQRRLEKIAARKDVYVEGYTVPKISIPRTSAYATIIIRMRDGTRSQFSIHELPHGLSVSPTLAGQKVAAVLANYLPQ